MLTVRQAETHRFIFEYTRHNGESPSLQDITDFFGLAGKSNVHRILVCLAERGFIKWIPHRPRSITIIKKPPLPNTQYFKAIQRPGEVQILIEMEK